MKFMNTSQNSMFNQINLCYPYIVRNFETPLEELGQLNQDIFIQMKGGAMR